jgi:hypothetical protein
MRHLNYYTLGDQTNEHISVDQRAIGEHICTVLPTPFDVSGDLVREVKKVQASVTSDDVARRA